MSLILEALRKSEAERRRGQVPDLHAERAPAAIPVRDVSSTRLWLGLAFAAAVALAMTLWLARNLPGPVPRASDAAVATTAIPGPAASTGAADAPADAADIAVTPADVAVAPAPPAVTAGQIAPPPAPASGHDAKPRDEVTAVAPTSPSEARKPPAAGPAENATGASPTAASKPPLAQFTAPPGQDPSASAAMPDPPQPVPEPVVSADPIQATTTAGIAPAAPPPSVAQMTMNLADLAVAEREQLPPLRMSMHLWSPTQRFAIIDGSRVSEGDRIGDAVVQEITASGVVLAWQGRRLKIPVR